MIVDQLKSILIHDAPGEFRAVAIDQAGLPWRLFSQRWKGDKEPAQVGQILSGRLRASAVAQGGAFVSLDNGEDVFLSGADLSGITLGMAVHVIIRAQARQGKLARAALTTAAPSPFDAYATWRNNLPGGADLPEISDRDSVASAFDEAQQSQVVLTGGGRLHIEHTRALTAMDVDSAGRISKGSAGARALSINRDAAREAARQITLRDIGGAVVLDCVDPLNKLAGDQVRDEFASACKTATQRKVQVFSPSRFGLMQVAIEWGSCPIVDRIAMDTAAGLFAALREVERAAEADGAGLFRIDLSSDDSSAYLSCQSLCDSMLAARFGGRVSISKSNNDVTVVRRK